MENNENNGVTGVATPNTQTPQVDYKQEYEKQRLEIEKLKTAISKTNSENAEYKRKAEAQMSEEEKRAKEWQEVLDSREQMQKELSQMKLEKDLLSNGFTTDESEKLIKGNFAVKDIAEIIKARVDSAVKSATAEFTKNSTSQSLMGKGSADGNAKSDFQVHQESKKKSNNIVEL